MLNPPGSHKGELVTHSAAVRFRAGRSYWRQKQKPMLFGGGSRFTLRWLEECKRIADMRYYFHLRVGPNLSPDEIGLDLPDLETAYLEAFKAAQEMWSELLVRTPLYEASRLQTSAARYC